MDELEKVIKEAKSDWAEAMLSGSFGIIKDEDKYIAQAVREHLEMEGWRRPQCEHDWYTDEKGFLICRKGCGE